jgi:hypothetical protein
MLTAFSFPAVVLDADAVVVVDGDGDDGFDEKVTAADGCGSMPYTIRLSSRTCGVWYLYDRETNMIIT